MGGRAGGQPGPAPRQVAFSVCADGSCRARLLLVRAAGAYADSVRREKGKERGGEGEERRGGEKEREREGEGREKKGREKEKLGAAGACTGWKQGVLDHVWALLPKAMLRSPGHTEHTSKKHCRSEIFFGGCAPRPRSYELQSCPALSAVTHIALLTRYSIPPAEGSMCYPGVLLLQCAQHLQQLLQAQLAHSA